MDNQPVDTIYIELAAKTDKFKKDVEDSVRSAKMSIQNDLQKSITAVGDEVDKVSAKLKGLSSAGRADIRLTGSSSSYSSGSNNTDAETNRQVIRRLDDLVTKLSATFGKNTTGGASSAGTTTDAYSLAMYKVSEAIQATTIKLDELVAKIEESATTSNKGNAAASGGGNKDQAITSLNKNADAINASIRATQQAVDQLKKATDVAAAVKQQAANAGMAAQKPREINQVVCSFCETPNDINVNTSGVCVACGAPLKPLKDVNQGIQDSVKKRQATVTTSLFGLGPTTRTDPSGFTTVDSSGRGSSPVVLPPEMQKGAGRTAGYSGDLQSMQQQMASQTANLDRAVAALASAATVLQSMSTGVESLAKLANIEQAPKVSMKQIAPVVAEAKTVQPSAAADTAIASRMDAFVKGAGSSLEAAAKDSANIEKAGAKDAADALVAGARKTTEATAGAGGSSAQGGFLSSIQNALRDLPGNAKNAMSAAGDKVKEVGAAVNDKIIQPLGTGIKALGEKIAEDPVTALSVVAEMAEKFLALGESLTKATSVVNNVAQAEGGGGKAGYTGDVAQESGGTAPSSGGAAVAGPQQMAKAVKSAASETEEEVTSMSNVVQSSLGNMGKVFSETKNPISALQSGLSSFVEGAGGAAGAGEGLAGALSGILGPIALVIAGITTLVAGLGTAIGFLQKTGEEGAKLAATINTLTTGMSVLAQNAGTSIQTVNNKLATLQASGITTRESMSSLSQFMGQQLPIDNIDKLARAGQNLAVAYGKNSSDVFNTMTYGIMSMNSEVLRQIGITETTTQMQDRYAVSVHKSSDALSMQERRLAIVNGIMTDAAAYTGLYEKSMETLGKQIQSLPRYVEEGTLAFGETLQPQLEASTEVATTFWKTFQSIFVQMRDEKLDDGSIKRVAETAEDGSQKLTNLGQVIHDIAESWKNVAVPAANLFIDVLSKIAGDAGTAFKDPATAIEKLSSDLGDAITSFQDWLDQATATAKPMTDVLGTILDLISKLIIGYAALAGASGQAWKDITSGFKGDFMTDIASAAKSAGDAMKKNLDDLGDASETTGEKFDKLYAKYVAQQQAINQKPMSQTAFAQQYERSYILSEQKTEGKVLKPEDLYMGGKNALMTEDQQELEFFKETGNKPTGTTKGFMPGMGGKSVQSVIDDINKKYHGAITIDSAKFLKNEPAVVLNPKVFSTMSMPDQAEALSLLDKTISRTLKTPQFMNWQTAQKTPTQGFESFIATGEASGGPTGKGLGNAGDIAQQAQAVQEMSKQAFKMIDDSQKSISDLEISYDDKRTSAAIAFGREQVKITDDYNISLTKAARDKAISDSRFEEDWNQQIADQIQENQKQQMLARKDLDEQELKEKIAYFNSLQTMQQNYDLSLQDAAQSRDASKVIQLMRQNEVQKRQAGQQFDQQHASEEQDFQYSLTKIPTNEAAVRALMQVEYDKQERQRALQYTRQLADMDKNYQDQQTAAAHQYDIQRAQMDQDEDRDKQLLQRANDQKMALMIQSWADQGILTGDSLQTIFKIMDKYYGVDGYFDNLQSDYADRLKKNTERNSQIAAQGQSVGTNNPGMPGAMPNAPVAPGAPVGISNPSTTSNFGNVNNNLNLSSPAANNNTSTLTLIDYAGPGSGSGVRLRSGPSTDASVIKSYNTGASFTATNYKDGWWKVRASDGQTGYLMDAAWIKSSVQSSYLPKFGKGGVAVADSPTTVEFGDKGKEAAFFVPMQGNQGAALSALLGLGGVGSSSRSGSSGDHQVLDVNIKVDASGTITPEVKDALLNEMAEVMREALPKVSKVRTIR